MPRAVFIIGLLVVLAVPLAGRAAVDPFEAFRCERAYGDRDFAAARQICLPLAEAGLADAQAILGALYRDGLGVARDYGAAARWYGAAARQGHVGARFHLGTMYRYGVGVPRDEVEAYAWFALAADAGHADAASARDLVAARLTAARLADAERRVAALRAGEAPAATQQPAEAASEAALAAPDSQALIDELRDLVRRAERERSADYRFLQRLRDLVRRYDWPWRYTLLDEDFQDGAMGPGWTVASGRFTIDRRAGLRTRFTPPARVRLGGDGGGDPAARIFGAILGEIARQQGGGAPRPGAAELFAAVAVSNAFVVDVEFVAFEAPAQGGGIDFGIYQGARRETGYRLAYRPGSRPSLALLRVLPTGAATVASVGLATRLEDGYAHRLEWRRGRNGRMVVLLDDAVTIETVDRAIGARFDGFHLLNRGGDYRIRRIAVYGAGG